MTGPVYLGIDPGRTGAWALVDRDGGAMWVEDLPYADNRLDMAALIAAWRFQMGDFSAVRAAIEFPMAFVNQSPTHNMTSGINFGMLLGALSVCQVPFNDPKPAGWKQKMHLSADKEKSRAMALQLFPVLAKDLRFKKDHGRAEALLLAEWLRRRELRIRVPREGD